MLQALTAALALRRSRPDPRIGRRLAAEAHKGDPTSKLLALHALARGTDGRTRRLLLDPLLGSEAGREEHAAWVLGERSLDARALGPLAALTARGGFAAMVARLTLERWLPRLRPPLPTVLPRPGGGLRIAQVSLQGRLDAELRGAGAGDGGGLATLLVSLTRALDAHPAVSEAVTFTRAFEDPSFPGLYSSAEEPVGQGSRIERLRFGPERYLSTPEQWAYRPEIEAEFARSIARHGPFDVAHLRFADVGTFAAARVFRRLGVPVVFTLAPDPHSVLRDGEASGQLDRTSFPAADLEHRYVFRAWLVDWLLREADALAVLPRPGIERELRELLGPSFDTIRPERLWTIPEGIAVDGAAERPMAPGGAAVRTLERAVAALPERRRGLPLLLTVARLNRVKGIPQLVEAWAGGATPRGLQPRGGRRRPGAADRRGAARAPGGRGRVQAAAGCPLRPRPAGSPAARRGAAAPARRRARHPGRRRARRRLRLPEPKGGVGLALLEALGAGLAVVGPDRGGPPTYIEDGRTGVLVDTTDLHALRAGLARAASARLDSARAERARSLVRERFTVGAMAEQLVEMYSNVTGEAALKAA